MSAGFMSPNGEAPESEHAVAATSSARPVAQDDFFGGYEWCLNPAQSFAALCALAQQEFARHDIPTAAWRRAEWRINLFLLLSAASCTIGDYLADRPYDLQGAVRRLPKLSAGFRYAEAALDAATALRHRRDRRAARLLRDKLADCIDLICIILAADSEDRPGDWARLGAAMRQISCAGLPHRLLGWRSRVPEAFRCQDMTHHDGFGLAGRLATVLEPTDQPVFLVGLRTAGAYLAPLVAAALKARGVAVAGWMSIRPKTGLSREERARLTRAIGQARRIVVVDDHPNTGGTFASALAILQGLGLPPERAVCLAPDHPAQLDWSQAVRGAACVTLPFSQLDKQRFLRDHTAVLDCLRHLYFRQGWTEVELRSSADVDRLNAVLAARLPHSFEDRAKRVFRVRLCKDGMAPIERHVLLKSVGWGWLGYHAAIASVRLPEFVPPLVGFRHGFLFSEWIGPPALAPQRPSRAQIISLLGEYVAARVNRLRLDTDPSVARGVRPAGWDSLSRTLSRPYGRLLGPLLRHRVRATLDRYRSPQPALIDGRMAPDEWVISDTGPVKVDFEHHAFGGAQPDIVDGCYDLACAIRDFDMSPVEEETLVADYERATGDGAARRRLPLYKLLAGLTAMRTAAYCVARCSNVEAGAAWNARYNHGRNFLNFHFARHCAAGANRRTERPRWSRRLLFLDLDGVLDAEFLGPLFQHTTPAGLRALSVLKEHGYSIVLNTGRSVEQVRRYCEIYSLPGGIAEYGSVFFDAVADTEIPLVGEPALRQLQLCRARLEQMPGVFLDPGYRYSLRAYRFAGELTVGLPERALARLLASDALDRLAPVAREADSHIVGKGLDKATALAFVKTYLPSHDGPVVAIGDSKHDLPMFDQADVAYLPANFSPAHARLVRGSKYRRLRKPRQFGLLEAACDLTGHPFAVDGWDRRSRADEHIIDALLRVADRPRYWRLLHALWPRSNGRAGLACAGR